MKHLTAIFEHEGKYYGISYDEGLTECQENKYWKQVPKLYEKKQVVSYTFEEVKEGLTDDDQV